ncbi:MAG: FAD-linked oxidoreductase-like protein [Benjaminiella poitrasii]|nr:MAG: FAD-linked oxidoreductase-like protein [Benjaminiella poitrasii]
MALSNWIKVPLMATRTLIGSKASTLLLASSSFYIYAQGTPAQAEPAAPVFSTTSSPMLTLMELRDEANRLAVHAKSTEELLMALFVYRLCAISWLVDLAPHMLQLADRLGLQAPLYWFIKQTFFRHFCGGESPDECMSSMDKLAQSGINCILDLSVEADLHLPSSDDEKSPSTAKYGRDEQYADVIASMIRTCVETAAHNANAMVAIKVTAFSPPELLLRLNQTLVALDQAFLQHQRDGRIDRVGLEHVVRHVLPSVSDADQQRKREAILQECGRLDVIEFRKLFHFQGVGRDVWWKSEDPKSLTAEDLAAYDRMMARLEDVCRLAADLKVGVMVDAEQSYFQDAIDHVAHHLQRKFNRRLSNQPQSPTVYNTYQMYTKSSRGRLELDVELSRRDEFTLAAKLVRGAYMVSERKRAEDMGYESPIHETLEETHASYNDGVQFLLTKIREHQEAGGEVTKEESPVVFMVASHNRESVILTIENMDRYQVSPQSGVVMFGQLFGMQDQLSYTLGQHGYAIYKYLPYGLIHEVIPYLLRRAQENSAILGGVAVERQLMWEEVKDRVTGKAKSSVSSSSDVSITGTATSV